jgi:hypothetical protein
MPGTFPKLKTRAVAQYPLTRGIRFRNQVIQFVDGTAQRYRDSSGPLHEWQIRLDLLDEAEMAAIEQFFTDNQGAFGTFAFTDPWDEQAYTNCSFVNGDLALTSLAELQGRTALTVRQNRN